MVLALREARAEYDIVRPRNLTIGLRRESESVTDAYPGLR
jgi:hypothetical protein